MKHAKKAEEEYASRLTNLVCNIPYGRFFLYELDGYRESDGSLNLRKTDMDGYFATFLANATFKLNVFDDEFRRGLPY